ncbi:unnamed protein product [Calypogeia fissa]
MPHCFSVVQHSVLGDTFGPTLTALRQSPRPATLLGQPSTITEEVPTMTITSRTASAAAEAPRDTIFSMLRLTNDLIKNVRFQDGSWSLGGLRSQLIARQHQPTRLSENICRLLDTIDLKSTTP